MGAQTEFAVTGPDELSSGEKSEGVQERRGRARGWAFRDPAKETRGNPVVWREIQGRGAGGQEKRGLQEKCSAVVGRRGR